MKEKQYSEWQQSSKHEPIPQVPKNQMTWVNVSTIYAYALYIQTYRQHRQLVSAQIDNGNEQTINSSFQEDLKANILYNLIRTINDIFKKEDKQRENSKIGQAFLGTDR